MIAIVDSGSTKADWRFVAKGASTIEKNTPGFNPFIHASEAIFKTLQEAFHAEIPTQKVTQVFYYGAGCSDDYRCEIVANALKELFTNAVITVYHDLLGAARATCKKEAGIACILGTGSNSCLYDGQRITDNVTNLGHIIGDEGSGYHLGKKLIQAYFYREFPDEIKTAFERQFPANPREIISNIYAGAANVYLSSFATFVGQFKDHDFIKNLVKDAFSEFLVRHVFKYQNYKDLPISFNGSIAFHFQDLLKEVLVDQGLRLGVIIQKPIERLVEFHLEP